MKTVFAFLVVLLFICFGCDLPSKRTKLSPEIRYMADTMFAKRRNQMIDEMESICKIRKEEFVSQFIDSLLLVEQSRIEELIGQ